jgi:hypothetical protein
VAADRPLNLGLVKREDERLVEAALRYLGSWDEALRAARIEPETVRKWNRWTISRFRKHIRDLGKAGIALSWAAIRQADPKLMKAAYEQFGSWTKTLRAFRLEPVYDHVQWTKREVIRRIIERRRNGEPLYARYLMLNGLSKLYGAALTKFGTWGKALRAAGIDPGTVHRRRAWTKENILSAIRKACRGRTPFGLEIEDPGLVAAARKVYGGWHEALGAAGIWSPKNRSGYRWTREELLAALSTRVRDGRSMRPTDVKDEENDLYMAARKLYGGFREAAKAAGCLGAVPPPRVSWPAGELINLLRRLGRKGPVFRRKLNQVKRKGFGTPAASIRRIWGTLRAAKRIAGVL